MKKIKPLSSWKKFDTRMILKCILVLIKYITLFSYLSLAESLTKEILKLVDLKVI